MTSVHECNFPTVLDMCAGLVSMNCFFCAAESVLCSKSRFSPLSIMVLFGAFLFVRKWLSKLRPMDTRWKTQYVLAQHVVSIFSFTFSFILGN